MGVIQKLCHLGEGREGDTQKTTYYMTPLTKKDNMGGQKLPILRNIASGRPLGSYCLLLK